MRDKMITAAQGAGVAVMAGSAFFVSVAVGVFVLGGLMLAAGLVADR